MRAALRMITALAIPLLPIRAQAADSMLRIGVLEDMAGPYADVSGPGSVAAARMAAEDFGPVLGRKVEIISADHQNKADIGVAIARRWFDVENVDMITGLGNSAVALAVRNIASGKGKIDIVTSAGTSDLTGKACTPTSFHWVYDSYALAKTITPSARPCRGTPRGSRTRSAASRWARYAFR